MKDSVQNSIRYCVSYFQLKLLIYYEIWLATYKELLKQPIPCCNFVLLIIHVVIYRFGHVRDERLSSQPANDVHNNVCYCVSGLTAYHLMSDTNVPTTFKNNFKYSIHCFNITLVALRH